MGVIQWHRAAARAGLAACTAFTCFIASAQDSFVPGRLLIKFKEGVSEGRAGQVLSGLNSQEQGSLPQLGIKVVQLPAQANERAYASAFRNRPEVEFAELDGIVHLGSTPNDPFLSNEWHLAKIGAPAAWNTTAGSGSIIIGVVDSGVDGTHPDLAARMVPGWNCMENNNNTADAIGHGTSVAGSVAASFNNGIGVAGVAGNCMIMPLRVTNSTGSATYSSIATAITYGADHGCRIVTASLAMVNSSAIDNAAQYLMNKKGLYFMASGNTGGMGGSNSNTIITVGATDQNDLKASFSTYGPWVDVAAPGVSIYTTARGGGYTWFGGTSAATPVAAGVGALIFSANPGLSATQALQCLTASVDDLGAAGRDDYFGWGRVNAEKAVLAALSTSGVDSRPPSLDFSSPAEGEILSNTRNLFATATDDVGVESVEFYINGSLKATLVAPPFSYAWNTLNSPNGNYVLKAVARDMSGNATESSKNVSVYNAPDTTAPNCAITSPSNGSSVATNMTVDVAATDNRAVTKVELYKNGTLAASSTSGWSFRLNTKKWARGTYTLVAKAYDAAGNSASSASVSVVK